MKLTMNFDLEEFTKSSTAEREGINNTPAEGSDAVENLRDLAVRILQPIRDHFGKPVRLNSGYRGPELNACVGGAKSSQHCSGEAADIEIMGVSNRVLAEWIRDNLSFDQLILEGHKPGDLNSGWVHVSYCGHKPEIEQRQDVYTATFESGKASYASGLNA